MGRTFKRSGLHKLECPCGAYVYATVAMLERHGLPACPCGERFQPEHAELAGLLGVDCDALDEYRRELSSILHGQAAHVQRGRAVQPAEHLAAQRVEARRRDRAYRNRLMALQCTAVAESDTIPF